LYRARKGRERGPSSLKRTYDSKTVEGDNGNGNLAKETCSSFFSPGLLPEEWIFFYILFYLFFCCVCVFIFTLLSASNACPRSLSLASSPPIPSASITQTQTHACSRRITRSRRMRTYVLSLSLSRSLPVTHTHAHTRAHTHTHTPFLEVLGAAAALALKEIFAVDWSLHPPHPPSALRPLPR